MKTSHEITNFASAWASENIQIEAYDPGDSVLNGYLEKLIEDASSEGISEEELEEHLGDLSDFISQAVEDVTDNEVERLASKDD